MENIKSRSRARIVAAWDFGISILSLAFVICLIYSFDIDSAYFVLKKEHPQLDPIAIDNLLNNLLSVAYIQIPFVGLFLSFNIWASYLLYQNSSPEADPVVALRNAVMWRNVGIVYMLVTLAFAGYLLTLETYDGVYAGLDAVYRGVLICIVWGFISDLQKVKHVFGGMSGNQAGQIAKI